MKKLLCTLFLVFVSILVTYADKTIYVAPNALGTKDGTSTANACMLNQIFGNLTPAVGLDAGTTTISFDASAAYSITTSGSPTTTSGCVLVTATSKIIFEGHNATLNAGQTGGSGVRMLRLGASTDVELRNLTFNNGTHPGSPGGAILFLGNNLLISGCTFYNCSGNAGGAIASRGKNVAISNSYFNSNKFTANANARGAAMTVTGTSTGGTLSIENTTFNNNNGIGLTAGNSCNGTAICTANDALGGTGFLNTISINNCTFYKNLAYINTNNAYTAIYMDELSGTSPSTTATFTNNTFYGNSNGALFIVGAKQTVKLFNNVIVGDSYAVASGGSAMDYGVLANTTLTTRPAIVGKNNYIVAKLPVNPTITEPTFQSGSNSNTFVTTSAQSDIDALYLNSTLSATSVPYLTITNALSPLVNNGTSGIVSGVTIPSTDITGFQRTANYTIGAYQATLNVANGTAQTINQNASLLSTTVQPTGKLTLASGKTLTTWAFTILSDASGTGTYLDNGTTTVTGITNVQQYLTSGRNWYISSPVSNAATTNLSSATSVNYYDELTGTWPSLISGSLVVGKGYISASTLTTGPVSFIGSLNTGAITIPLTRTSGMTKEGFNLVGNPYSSYLDWALVDTTSAKVLSTIWYRTQTPGNSYIFDTYNGKGNVSTNLGATKVTNLIPPMQAFWVRLKQGETEGNLAFSNTLRSHGDFSTNTFKAPSAINQAQQLLRLEVSNAVKRDEALIYFNENASNGYDGYDSPKMTNGSASVPEIYTNSGSEKLVINGLKSMTADIELPLGFTSGQANTFSIRASEITNLDDIDILLKDKFLNRQFNLKNGEAYTFTSDSITTNTRFLILFKSKSGPTAIESNSSTAKIHIQSDNGRIIITNENNLENNIPIAIYNSIGQQVANFNLSQPRTEVNIHFPTGMYVVRLKLINGISTQKIIIE